MLASLFSESVLHIVKYSGQTLASFVWIYDFIIISCFFLIKFSENCKHFYICWWVYFVRVAFILWEKVCRTDTLALCVWLYEFIINRMRTTLSNAWPFFTPLVGPVKGQRSSESRWENSYFTTINLASQHQGAGIKRSVHHITVLSRGLKGAHHWVSNMSRGVSI